MMHTQASMSTALGKHLSHIGKHVEVNVIDSSDIRAAISELRNIQIEFEQQLADSKASQDKNDH
jgi:hypothetical protein